MVTRFDRRGSDARDLLAVYALDAVDDLERRSVERLVAEDADAARELASLQETAASLAPEHEPPADLRAVVLERVAVTPQDSEARRAAGGAAAAQQRRRDPRRRALALAVAAAVAAAVAVPTVVARNERVRAVAAQEQAQLLLDVLADPGATVLHSPVTGGGEAVGVLTDERALLVAEGLPELDRGRVYQLWAMRDGVPQPSTLLPSDDGVVQVLADNYQPGDGLALTVEPSGGSPAPTTDPLVVLLPG